MLETLYYISQIIAAVMIFGSLLFVGLQMRQNTDQLKENQLSNLLSIEVATAQMHQNLTLEVADNGELAEILMRGSGDISALDATELVRVSILLGGIMSVTQVGYLHYREGQQNDEIWQSQAASIMTFISRPGGIVWWQFTRNNYAPAYRAWVDGLVGLGPLQPPGLPEGHPGVPQTAVHVPGGENDGEAATA